MLKLDIINSTVLPRMGAAAVTSLTQTKASRAAVVQFKLSLKALLCAHPWDFLKKQATLTAAEGITPIYGYTYAFALPKDFCRIVEEEPTGWAYDIVAGYIYSNSTTFQLSYVAYPYAGDWAAVTGIGAVSNWIELANDSVIFDNPVLPNTLYEVLGIHVASKCSYQITGDTNDIKLLTELYNRELLTAKSSVSQQKRDMVIEADDWESARL